MLHKFFRIIFLLTITFAGKIQSQNFAAGIDLGIAVCYDGSVQTWGFNYYGELGNGSTNNSSLPGPALISDVIAVSSDGGHCLAIKSDSTVWSWGWNNYGQLGNGTFLDTNIPGPVIGISEVIAIATGNNHSIALKKDGTVWAWGCNSWGMLGNGNFDSSAVPVQVIGLTNVIQIATGVFQNLALKNDGTVWAWGRNLNGELGIGSTINQNVPVQVQSLQNVVRVCVGEYHSMAIKNDSTLWLWGAGNWGQLGNGGGDETLPIQSSLTGIISVAGGTGHTLALSADGTLWCSGLNSTGQLGDSSTWNVSFFKHLFSIINVKEVYSSTSNSFALKNDGTLWGWGYNNYGGLGLGHQATVLYPHQVTSICYLATTPVHHDHYLHGILYTDSILNCIYDSLEMKAPVVAIKVIPGNFYSSADNFGRYSVGIDDSVNYTVTPIIPGLFAPYISSICPPSYNLSLTGNNAHDTSGIDFGFDYAPCALLSTDISASRKRRCFRNNFTLSYSNSGILPAANAEIHLQLDQYDVLISSSHPFSIDPTDSSYVFSLGTVYPYANGQIYLVDSVKCIPGITGLTQCSKAWILPPNPCYIDSTTGPTWDHSSVSVDGRCINDTVVFYIINTGSDMNASRNYRLYADNILMQTSSYQLQSGDTLDVHVFSNGSTLRLEADQSVGHPGQSFPRATLEGCGTNSLGNFSFGLVDRVLHDDLDPDIEISCLQIRDSYDPNEKISSPIGISTAHIVLEGIPIDYTVCFQNTGSDTAYKIIIIDSISSVFDISTIEIGSASHPFTYGFSGEGIPVIKFTFDNINLPDSTTDELNSHGWVKFKISPFPFLTIGTRLENFADIVFDYNTPIRTNTAFVTLGNYITTNVPNESIQQKSNRYYPTIVTNSLFIENTFNNPLQTIHIFSADGKLIISHNFVNEQLHKVDVSELKMGIYIVHCTNKFSSENFKLIKM